MTTETEDTSSPSLFKYHLLELDPKERILPAIAFYMDIPWNDSSHRTSFLKACKHYFQNYIVGFEISKIAKIHHIHMYTHSTEKQYAAFRAQMVRQFDLRGRATKNLRKQYGKIKKVIKTPDNMISYTIKSKDYVVMNYDSDYIKRCEAASFLSIPTKDSQSTIIPYLLESWNKYKPNKLRVTALVCKRWYEMTGNNISPQKLTTLLTASGILSWENYALHVGGAWLNEYSPHPQECNPIDVTWDESIIKL